MTHMSAMTRELIFGDMHFRRQKFYDSCICNKSLNVNHWFHNFGSGILMALSK